MKRAICLNRISLCRDKFDSNEELLKRVGKEKELSRETWENKEDPNYKPCKGKKVAAVCFLIKLMVLRMQR